MPPPFPPFPTSVCACAFFVRAVRALCGGGEGLAFVTSSFRLESGVAAQPSNAALAAATAFWVSAAVPSGTWAITSVVFESMTSMYYGNSHQVSGARDQGADGAIRAITLPGLVEGTQAPLMYWCS